MSRGTARARVALFYAIIVLFALAGVATHPLARARYHLRYVSAAEIQLDGTAGATLKGHARALVQNAAARSLLVPDLVERALAEAERDDGVCYRALVFELATGSGARPPSEPVLRVMLACLRSRDAKLRAWALARLPVDLRLVDAVSRHASWIAAHEKEATYPEKDELVRWLRAIALANAELVRRDGLAGPTGEPQPDLAWSVFVSGVMTGERGSVAVTLDGFARAASLLRAWLDRYRALLPEQLHP